MARTRAQIKKTITDRFLTSEFIQNAYELDPNASFEEQFSIVSFENIIIEIFTIASFILEQLFDKHVIEINQLIETQKTHSGPWIREQLLNFQYGFNLIPNTDKWNNGAATDEEIADSRIIKYAAVAETSDGKGVVAKIATEVDGELSPLDSTQMEAVSYWIKEIKPAGIPYTVINYLPDLLQLNIRIFRDPLILDQNGVHRIKGNKPVEEALKEYLKSLPFNGELQLQALADKLQAAEGVKIVSIDSASSAWVNAETGNYNAFTGIDVRRVPVSGYFKIENFDGITYGE